MDKTGWRGYGRSPSLGRALCGGLGALALALPGCGGGGDEPLSARESAQAVEPTDQVAMVVYWDYCEGACNGMNGTRMSALIFPGGSTGGSGDHSPAWSPDGMRLAFDRNGDIMVIHVTDGSPPVNLTNHPAADRNPAWSPDGTTIAFASDRDGASALFLMKPDGTGTVRLPVPVIAASGPTWSPDSTSIAFTCVVQEGNNDICLTKRDGSGFARLTDHPASDFGPAWSPTGAKIAFVTARYGADPTGNSGLETQIAEMRPDGSEVRSLGITGFGPAWSPDGSRLAWTYWEPCEFMICPLVGGINVEGAWWSWASDPAWRPGVAQPPSPPPQPPPPNRPPTLAPVANQRHAAGQTVSLALSASDPDGDTLTYSASGLPPDLKIDASSGSISGKATSTGDHTVTVEVIDGHGGIASTAFTWTITPPPNQPPALAPVAKQSHKVGAAVSMALSASDPNGDALSFSATGLPTGLSINATTGLIAGTPTRTGSYSVTARVSDGRGGSAARSFTWRITR